VIRGINSAYIRRQKGQARISRVQDRLAYHGLDPAKEADAGKVLIEQGADLSCKHIRSTAPKAGCPRSRHVITFGQASDMAQYPSFPPCGSSSLDDWDPLITIARTKKRSMDGTMGKSTDTMGRHRCRHGWHRRESQTTKVLRHFLPT